MDKFKDIEPGTLVYCIEDDDFSGYLFMATCMDYVIVCAEYMSCEGDFSEQLKEMCQECYEWQGIDLNIFPAKRVFLTEAEAMKNMY